MSQKTVRTRTGRIATAVAAAMLVPLVALGGGVAAWAEPAPESDSGTATGVESAPQDAPETTETAEPLDLVEIEPTASGDAVTGGTFAWGVRASIRSYLEQHGHTEGWVQAYDGATYKKGDAAALFPVTGGSVDEQAGTASIEIGGAFEMVGFGEPWLHFTDLRLDIDGGAAELTVDMIESYNVSTRTDDIVLATFEVPDGGLAIADERLELTTGSGRFTDEIGRDHLPSYGGPTYVGANAYTDPFTLSLDFGDADDPGSDPDDPGTPKTGPYGVSSGTAYSDSEATIRVTPGYAVNAAGDTVLTVEGFGFDPGNASMPRNVYVGLGSMREPSLPEKWRRSKGGASGPGADFDYGSTRFVASHLSGDASAADAVISANGRWKFTMTVPGKDVPSFFGGTIDCVAKQCGVFAFGAHGATHAKNEAFTPVFFQGQDESDWPSRGDDPPTTVDPDDDEDGDGDGDPDGENPDDDKDPEQPGTKDCEPGGTSTGKNAAGAELTATPAKCLSDANQTVKLQGKGYPTSRDGNTFGGVYVLFGWVDTAAENWAPSAGGVSGTTYHYAKDGTPAGTFQKMVNFPGNTTGEGMPTMNAQGEWELDMPIQASRFESAQGKQIDCYKVTCGIITLGAHGAVLPGGEVFTPIYFTGDPSDTGTDKPGGTGTTSPTANPNVQNPTGVQGTTGGQPTASGPLAKSGAGSELRTMTIFAVLLLSGALFAFALVRTRRQSTL